MIFGSWRTSFQKAYFFDIQLLHSPKCQHMKLSVNKRLYHISDGHAHYKLPLKIWKFGSLLLIVTVVEKITTGYHRFIKHTCLLHLC